MSIWSSVRLEGDPLSDLPARDGYTGELDTPGLSTPEPGAVGVATAIGWHDFIRLSCDGGQLPSQGEVLITIDQAKALIQALTIAIDDISEA